MKFEDRDLDEEKLEEFLDEVRRMILPVLTYSPKYKETFVGKIKNKFKEGVVNGDFWKEKPQDNNAGLVRLTKPAKSSATYLTEQESSGQPLRKKEV